MHLKIVAAIFALALVLPASASTYTVNNLGDATDATPGNNICDAGGGVCTFRAAIVESNAHAGTDTVAFGVTGVISTAATLSVNDVTIIDGTTAPGYAGVPLVHVDGGSTVAFGLVFNPAAIGSTLTALEVSGYTSNGLRILTDNVTVQRSYIGPITQGTPNGIGVAVIGINNLIGGNDGFGNVISGNTSDGIQVTGEGATISDNFIGTNVAGTAALPNGGDGISIIGASTAHIVSTSANGQNVISGNGDDGISLSGAQNVIVTDNFIGTNVTGTAAIPNFNGVRIVNTTNSSIGTSTAGRNIISGNSFDGIFINDSPGTVVVNNYIGTDVTGTTALANSYGILMSSSFVTIGDPTAGNLISGNTFDGIFFGSGGGSNFFAPITILHNIIGLDAAGVNILGNGLDGVRGCCTTLATIGAADPNTGNVISGNGSEGIFIYTTLNVTIQGNVIGLRADGSDVRGNGSAGIIVDSSTGVTIGGTQAGARNVISGNSTDGVIFRNTNVNSTISGNYIGTDVTGTIDLGNLANGVDILSGSTMNTVTGNVISGNDLSGIRVDSAAQTFTNNLIGRNAANSASIPNGQYGIALEGAATGNSFTGNTIASNVLAGVHGHPISTDNDFAANSVFSNGGLGIDLDPAGVNANDPLDPDSGANSLQNFPVISYATQLQVGGTINSNPNTPLTIHVYSNTSADPSGFGEGETHLPGSASVVTDASGNASFTLFYGSPIPVGRIITGTANGPHGTSEFSQANVAVVAPPVLQFSNSTYSVAENAGSAAITVTRTGETNSLVTVQFSTSPGTATPSADYVPVVGIIAFPAGVTSQTFNVPIVNDTIDEPNETLTLNLSNPGSATLGLSSATLTIEDDDVAAAAIPTLSEWMLLLLAALLGMAALSRWKA